MTAHTEAEARKKWCPFAKIKNGMNRYSDVVGDAKELHCIGSDCMAWREFQPVHKNNEEAPQKVTYCGLVGKP